MRDYFDDPRYIELFADVRVKVIFPRKLKRINKLFKYRLTTKDMKEFHKLQFNIINAGWKTFDMG
ncbi:hypothetical protein D3C85_1828770 [compost metagenome]